ncbi:hypothetical protein I0D68_12830 [Pseudomonas lalucatii]|nr:hypothetical protein I0D68_12830 [Pseudomonas lalucatii]
MQLQPASLAGVALKLATLSRYRIASAERVQLPRRPGNPLLQPFAPQPALLVSQLPLRGGGRLAAINSQLDAAVPGTIPCVASSMRPWACSSRCRPPVRPGCSAATSTAARPPRRGAGMRPPAAN